MAQPILVTPKLPTVAGTVTQYPLLGTDLLTYVAFQHLHVVPDSIDVDKFSEALARSLSAFPTFAGRLRQEGGKWWVELTNSGVPIVVEKDVTTSPPEDWVMTETDLKPWVEPVNVAGIMNNDLPLMNVKLSYFAHGTIIGITASHMLADGSLMLKFAQHLSQNYQGLSPDPLETYYLPSPAPLLEKEEFDKINASRPSAHVGVQNALPLMGADLMKSRPVKIRITTDQALKLKSFVAAQIAAYPSEVAATEAATISRQDAISAFIISTLNKHIAKPVLHIQNTLNYRDFADPQTVGTNALTYARAEIPESETKSIGHIAKSIRQSLVEARQPVSLKKDLGWLQQVFTEAANSGGKVVNIIQPDHYATLNSNLTYDWNSAHFGYPGATQFHQAWFGDRYIRVFRSNPQIEEGKVIDSREGSIDILFRVETSARDAVFATLEADLKALDETGELFK